MDHQKVARMVPVVKGMKGCEIRQMGTLTAQIVQIHNLLEIEIDHTKTRTPTYRKFVKRREREKIETTNHLGINIQVIFFFHYLFV